MDSLPRRLVAVVAAALLVSTAVLGGSYLGLAAPFSGSVYDTVARGDERVESPYGAATVTYDEYGVPHVEAENERALYYAVGYVQARDRLFQMDLQRRLISGNLSAVFGERALESDRFHRKLDFEGAAEASWRQLRDTEAGPSMEAFAAGVNEYVETGALPPEFRMLDYEPTRWTPVDSLLIGKQLAWSLSGSFADLRRATVRRRLGPEAMALYPDALPHDTPIVRNRTASDAEPVAANASAAVDGEGLGALYEWVSAYEPASGVGSNNWVVSGSETASGSPLLANDPHLALTVPSVWYEMHLRADGVATRGVGFPGIPYVVIGRTPDVAWGVTNVGGDFLDVYTYRSDGDTYQYRGETRSFETATETIRVRDGSDHRLVNVTVRKSVHGPVIRREGVVVGVGWPGFSATNESLGVYRLNHARDVDDVRDALSVWDVPAQNFVVATRAGETRYFAAGKYPVRRTGDRVVRGDRVFNGSAGQGEWAGYTPYGVSSWSGFVPFESVPQVENPDYLATANQRTVDDPPFYMGTGMTYADPYRGQRLYDLLDGRAAADEPVDPAFAREMQRDRRSEAAAAFVPFALEATAQLDPAVRSRAASLEGWNYSMRAESESALVYRLWVEAYRNETFGDEFYSNGLDERYYPKLSVLASLPADSEWFDDQSTRERETRADIAARAMRQAVARIETQGYETYGEYNRLDLEHPFEQPYMGFPSRRMGGSPYTVYNFRGDPATQVGSSMRMVVSFEGQSSLVLPGGNSGVFWSAHYHDQLEEWAAGEPKPMPMTVPEREPDIVFTEAAS